MNFLTFIYTLRLLLSLGIITTLSSCGMVGYSAEVPSAPSYVVPSMSASSNSSLNRNSVSTAKRVVVKTGSLNLDTSNVREASESIEQITVAQGGHILSYDERDDKNKDASFSIRVPAQNLVSMMDQIAALGKVTYRKITVKDKTREMIAQKARLDKLKKRKSRLEAIYRSLGTKDMTAKLELEETLSEIEEEIFTMEEGMRQMQKFAQFSKLDVSLSQKTIRGPVGAALDGASWTWDKLFTIRE